MLKALSESWDGGGGGGGEAGVQGVNSASLVTPPSTFLLSPLFLHLFLSNFIQNCPIFYLFWFFFFLCISRIMMRSCKLMSMDTMR